ncbi:hypothetical protein FOCC_FOCC012028 [Frankliniella occidentalis]|nr:hypothetical protein FOCC_FOCC012028 [Frankliniella occidentalis]
MVVSLFRTDLDLAFRNRARVPVWCGFVSDWRHTPTLPIMRVAYTGEVPPATRSKAAYMCEGGYGPLPAIHGSVAGLGGALQGGLGQGLAGLGGGFNLGAGPVCPSLDVRVATSTASTGGAPGSAPGAQHGSSAAAKKDSDHIKRPMNAFMRLRDVHLKKYPDYKYRPRRKQKTVKSQGYPYSIPYPSVPMDALRAGPREEARHYRGLGGPYVVRIHGRGKEVFHEDEKPKPLGTPRM